ncbi:FecR family protein [Dongia deserti]|uniref:FecR family protein n=1 Tax=Dongia deserti TaxID=2268030 RepID=UPI0013C4CCAF|nr:FecR family protein [Dongia deserti]
MSISPRLARLWLGPVLLALAVTATGSARADDGILNWIVRSISFNEDGDVIPASAMQVPQVGTALASGQQISTAGGQHMVLVNGRDLVEISPNTTLVIGDSDSTTSDPNLNLVTGTVHVEVGKRTPGQTFSVGATYLVATVKGTQFDVSTSSAGSAVSVTEGVVGVSSLRTGKSVDVTAGNTATVRRDAPDAPSLVPTNRSPSSVGGDTSTASAGAKSGSDGGSDGSGSGGSGSGGSGSGGSDSGSSDSGGSSSGSSGSSDGSSGGVGGAVGDTADAVGGAVGDTADAVGGAVGDVTGAVGDTVGGPVGGAVSGVGGAVGGAVSGVGGAVGGAVGGLGGAVGGLLK